MEEHDKIALRSAMDEHNLTKVAAVFMVDVELKMIKKQGFLNFRQALFIFL
jgi:hypothetical protein